MIEPAPYFLTPTAMGTAIMALGADPRGKSGGTRTPAVTDDATALKVAAR